MTALVVADRPMPAALRNMVDRFVAQAAARGQAAVPTLPVWHHPDALEFRRQLRARMTPGQQGDCKSWFQILRAAYPPVDDAVANGRLLTLWITCKSMPRFVWDPDVTLASVVDASPRFLPSVGEIRTVLTAMVWPLHAEDQALEEIHNARPAPRPSPVVLGIEASEPYVLPFPPPWATDRSMRPAAGPLDLRDRMHSTARPPVRTIAQQLAALRNGTA